MRKNVLSGEEYPPGKLVQMEHVAWAAPPAWHIHHVECEAASPCYTVPWREELFVVFPGHIYPAEQRRTQPRAPQVPLSTYPSTEGAVVQQAGAGQVGYGCRVFVLPFLFLLPILNFLGQESSSLPSTAVPALISPLMTLKVYIKDDIFWLAFGPKGHPSFQWFYPTSSFLER